MIVPGTRRLIRGASEQPLRVGGPCRGRVGHRVGERTECGELTLKALRTDFPLGVASRLPCRAVGPLSKTATTIAPMCAAVEPSWSTAENTTATIALVIRV